MLKKIAFVGFGELGKQFLLMLEFKNESNLTTVFFDDELVKHGIKNARPFNDYENENDPNSSSKTMKTKSK